MKYRGFDKAYVVFDYAVFFFLEKPIPATPSASRARVAGSGTAVVVALRDTLSKPMSKGPWLSAWANRT